MLIDWATRTWYHSIQHSLWLMTRKSIPAFLKTTKPSQNLVRESEACRHDTKPQMCNINTYSHFFWTLNKSCILKQLFCLMTTSCNAIRINNKAYMCSFTFYMHIRQIFFKNIPFVCKLFDNQ